MRLLIQTGAADDAAAARRDAMTYRMISIVAAVAAFAWGFSLLVEQTQRSVRPESARVACQDSAGGCARPALR